MKTPEQWLEEFGMHYVTYQSSQFGPKDIELEKYFVSLIQAIQKDAADSVIWVVKAELETIQKLAKGTLNKLGTNP